jgi:predicted AlkP superfamily pyrophosphatase or phosphodiesterase
MSPSRIPHRVRHALSPLLAILVVACNAVVVAAPARPRVTRVLLVSVDGLRPDILLRGDTPVMRALIARGAFTMWARTTAVATTLPSHTSMLTGMTPPHHGIVWNSDLPLTHPVYPSRPTLMELAHQVGLTTAMATGKSKFHALARPGTLDWVYVPADSTMPDAAVADTTVAWIRRGAPQVMFVHLPAVDTAGHAKGWGSREQLAAVAEADRCLGRILAALAASGKLDSTVVLVSSDHGGAGRGHGPDDPRSRHIPWIVAGPGIRAGIDLTGDAGLEVNTEDTFATLCMALGLDPGVGIDGHAVLQAFEPVDR